MQWNDAGLPQPFAIDCKCLLGSFGFAQILELVLMRINAHNVTQGRPIIPPLLSSWDLLRSWLHPLDQALN